VVGPFSRGDNPLQYYNTMFSLQYLNEYADAVLFTNNDILSGAYNNVNVHNTRQVSFEDMNETFSRDIASIFFPLKQGTSPSSFVNPCMGTFVSTLCPLKSLRFVRVASATQSSTSLITSSSKNSSSVNGGGASVSTLHNESASLSTPVPWEVLTKKANDKLGIERGRNHVVFAAHITMRGKGEAASHDEDESLLLSQPEEEEVRRSFVKHNKAITSWHPSSVMFNRAVSPIAHTSRSVSLAVNSSEMSSIVKHVSKLAAIKFYAKAYLHSYIRYGITEEDFAEAFESMNNIVSAYDEMSVDI
jgi:tubulin delta